jgi:hypothetical protein
MHWGKNFRAHRLSYAVFNGDFDDHWHVLHTCDNPLCLNPKHLWLGTTQENTADRNAKNRQAKGKRLSDSIKNKVRGERAPRAKLTESKVREIFRLLRTGLTHSQIAFRFDVSRSAISYIFRGESWSHIKE